MNDDPENESPYAALRVRALEYLTVNGGRVTEDDLIRFLFGASTKPALWTSLLRNVMTGDDRFRETFGNTWSLAAEPEPLEATLKEFVAIDVETTGLRPYQHRIIEIGLARYRNNRCVDRYSALVNPERRLPDYIVKLTGLTDSDLIPAPLFAQIAPDVVQFIGSSPLLGHNVGFDLGFLNAELDRAQIRKVENPWIDTIPLAMRVLGRRVRPSLDRVSTAVGLGRTGRHRALADAELTAEVALRLWARAIAEGAEPHELLAIGRQSRGVDLPVGSTSGTMLDRSLLDGLPSSPGVYIMVDRNEKILYVGKAKSIRDRVASYYAQPLGYTRKMDGLIEQIHRIEHEETGSELLALLLESQLIRRYQPPYNRMLRNSESYPFIRIDPANNWPTLRLARHPRPDGARYFGPYRSKATAKSAIELLNRRYRLRSCGRGFRTPASYGNPCLELDLKRCDGPCIGRANASEYKAGVNAVLAFLEGDGDALLNEISAEIEGAIVELRYEQAQRLRETLEILERLHAEQSALDEMRLQAPYLIIQPAPSKGEIQVMVIISGQWWSSICAKADITNEDLAARLGESWERYEQSGIAPLGHASVDDANIIARWRKLPSSAANVVQLPDADEHKWPEIATQVLEVGRSIVKVSQEMTRDKVVVADYNTLDTEGTVESSS